MWKTFISPERVATVETMDVMRCPILHNPWDYHYNFTIQTKAVSPSDRRSPNNSRNSLMLSEKKPNFSFEPGDAASRMTAAGSLFEQGKFNWAEELLKEAFEIFLKTLGPQHNSTKGELSLFVVEVFV